MSEIKERPIPFSAPMVRAILEDRKTVTRRAVRAGFNPDDLEGTLSANECRKLYRELPQHFGASYFCPYGQPGDRLVPATNTRFQHSATYGNPSAATGTPTRGSGWSSSSG